MYVHFLFRNTYFVFHLYQLIFKISISVWNQNIFNKYATFYNERHYNTTIDNIHTYEYRQNQISFLQ